MANSKLQPSPSKPDSSKHIHILGLGNLGLLYAHSLANLPSPPPITLLFHRPSLLQEWDEAGRHISITTNGVINSAGHFSVEDISSPSASPKTRIENLIVATKTLHVVKALELVKGRLDESSTVLFMQNGMGTLEEVDQHVFPNISTRPKYLTSVTSHGVYNLFPFSSVHAGLASVSIGRSLQIPPPANPSKAQYLINQIVSAPVLSATKFLPQELFYLQLEKLVVNAMINPLTAIFHCKNGELFDKGPILKLMRLLLLEVTQVIQSLPEIRNSEDPEIEERFSTQALEVKVLDVAEKTAQNTSSMLQDVQAGRETEIEYINGWIVKMGREMGLDVEHNEKLVEMVKTRDRIGVEEVREHFEGPGDKVRASDAFSWALWP